MAAKKKTTAKKRTKKADIKEGDIDWKPKRKGNWSASERPRHCRNQRCKSTNSSVTDTKQFPSPPRTIRYRKCDDCGQKYTTIDTDC